MQEFENKEALEIVLSNRIASIIKRNLQKQDHVSILFSGGSTPKGLLNRLASMPLDWQRLKISLVDDRMVAVDSPFSNAGMIQRELLERIPSIEPSPTFVPLVLFPSNFEQNLNDLNKGLELLGNIDIVLLGMGLDGHFASIFPQDKASYQGLSHSYEAPLLYTKAPAFPEDRITFSWPFLKTAKHLFLHVTGAPKKEIIQQNHQDSNLPIQTLLNDHQNNLEIVWAP